MPNTRKQVLTIAGSDSGGGAGIQADIKTVTMLGGHAMTAITAITAQNTLGVTGVHPVPTEIVLAQIDAVISLVSDIRTRWTIPDARIIGHSDLAPERKQDPGERFPWKRLASVGHGLWFEPAQERIAALGAPLGLGDEGLGVIVLRSGLHRLGYGLPPGGDYDEATKATVEAFQRHWRPSKVDGVADGETRATLMGVLQLATAESATGVMN